jgi:hypothetical protein
MGFNPFARHTESQPEPAQVQPITEATTVEPPADAKPTTTVAATVATTSVPTSPTMRIANPFSHHAVGPKVRPKVERTRKLPAQALLDWLQRWDKPTVRARDICIYGPIYTRKREAAIKQAEVLVKYNWLIPIEPSRRDSLEWQIVRAPIIQPIIGIPDRSSTNVAK